nr:IS110 family transposase [Candidatus Hakubella thermalkaliphila]
MEVVYSRCAGLDVHKKTVVACVLIREGAQVQKEIRTFSIMTSDLLVLHDWLLAHGVREVAMESTGIYWKPIFNLLEASFRVLLVNAAHIKAVPGRKTDVKDCEWIAELLSYGLLKASFIPPKPIRELRDLTRYRKSLIDERVREVNRLHKLLESANIKLSSVATDVMGKLSVNPVATRKCGVPGGSACEGDRGRYPSPGVGNGCVDPAFPALGSVQPGSSYQRGSRYRGTGPVRQRFPAEQAGSHSGSASPLASAWRRRPELGRPGSGN